MIENDEKVQKLKDFLKKKNPQLSNNEVEEISKNLYELGLFLVRLKLKQHSKPPKPDEARGFEQITREPP